MLKRSGLFVLTLMIVVALFGFTPGRAMAATPARLAQAQAPVALAASPILRREVFGFALASSLSDPTYGYPTWNFSLLSTVAYFGLHVQGDGTFAADQGWSVWNSAQLTNLLNAAHSRGTKVVVTIILQDFAAGTPTMCAGLAHAATTIANTVAEVKAKGVDGVNLDYEGLNGSCGSTTDPSFARHSFTSLASSLRSSLPAGSYLSVDTYASSATDPLGFYDVPGLAAAVDSFFVMAYDLEYSNWSRPPLNCSSFCLGPTAPLSGYYYNVTDTTAQYVAVVPASKVIMGVPYYGRKSCVSGATPNGYPIGSVVADTYLDASTEATAPAPGFVAGSYVAHRDANDPAGQERWDTWFNTNMNCTRELYWDDVTSLGLKYDLINRTNLRGVGIWNLNYGGGAPELWRLLSDKFGTSTPWSSLGGVATSPPAASSRGTTIADVFVRGTDNGMWGELVTGTSGNGWAPYGGGLASKPGAAAWSPTRIDVFVGGTDGQLWHRWSEGGSWRAWEPLGGVVTSGPGVSSWGVNRLDVFVQGSDSQLWHRWWDGVAWRAWEPLGGVLNSDPTAVAWGPNRIDVFVRGTDSQLWHKWWDGIAWRAWEPLGGVLTSGPAAASCASGRLDIFALGIDAALYQLTFNGRWGQWQRLGGQWTSDPAAVCHPGTTAIDVFERGPNNDVWKTSVPAG
jgi:spore germination protein YaaH